MLADLFLRVIIISQTRKMTPKIMNDNPPPTKPLGIVMKDNFSLSCRDSGISIVPSNHIPGTKILGTSRNILQLHLALYIRFLVRDYN